MKRILCLAFDKKCEIEFLARWCARFSPSVGVEPSPPAESLLLDVTGVAHLFGGEAGLGETILRELGAKGLRVQAAVADTIGAAWAVAHFGSKEEGGRRKAEGGAAGCQLSVVSCQLSADPPRGCPADHGPQTTDLSSFILHPSSFLLVPAGQTLAALRPLPVAALRLPAAVVLLLRELGIRRIEQLEALPRRELLPRFGPELLEHWDRTVGRLDEPLPVHRPGLRFAAGWSPEVPIARREAIEAGLAELAGRLSEMLRRAGLGAMQLECRLECTVGDPLEISVGLFHPTAWARHLVELLAVRLERLRIAGPVRHIRLAAPATAPLEPRQQELFEEGGGGNGEAERSLGLRSWVLGLGFQTQDPRPENQGPRTKTPPASPQPLAPLVDRLSNRLGQDAVVRARLIPDAQPEMAYRYVPLVKRRRRLPQSVPLLRRSSAFHRLSTACSKQWHTAAPRPLRLLATPLLLPVGRPGHHAKHGRLRFSGHVHQIAKTWGPERIETGWWRGQAVGRDYYRVETTTGRRFWIFRNLRDGLWFLHGVFE
ncbi:MAG: DNA polymerase Y family protein [Thermoguttaceae bacterium]|jgi:protein ImuB